MAYGIELISFNGTVLVTTEGSSVVYLLREEGNLVIPSNQIGYSRQDKSWYYKDFAVNWGTPNVIIMARPNDTTTTRLWCTTLSTGITRVYSDRACTINYKVFQRASDSFTLPYENDYGVEVYGTDGTTLWWSSNSLSSRVRAVVDSGYWTDPDGLKPFASITQSIITQYDIGVNYLYQNQSGEKFRRYVTRFDQSGTRVYGGYATYLGSTTFVPGATGWYTQQWPAYISQTQLYTYPQSTVPAATFIASFTS